MATFIRSSITKSGIYAFFLIVHIAILKGEEHSRCPSLSDNPICPCYKFNKELFLKCPSATPNIVKNALTKTKGIIHSLSIDDLDHSTTELSRDFFPSHIKIKHLQITQTGIEKINPNAFTSLRDSLKSLSVEASKLTEIPYESFFKLFNIVAIDFQRNNIQYIQANTFKGLKLKKISLRGNKIANISDHAFQYLDQFLIELDVTENFLETFPLQPLGNLNKLTHLKLGSNKINSIPGNVNVTIPNLVQLDLSSNLLTKVDKNWFNSIPNIKILFISRNMIHEIAEDAFYSLINLELIDLSRNKIVNIGKNTFSKNLNLGSIDLNYNHLHHINGLFNNLKQLFELFLSENNIHEIPNDAFNNTVGLKVLHIEYNAIQLLRPNCFDSLQNVTMLFIGSNFIKILPKNIFRFNRKIEMLGLDNNKIQELDDSVFENLVSMTVIRLQSNELNHVKRNLFSPLKELLELHLQDNVIKNIDSHAFITLQKLQYINLRGNNLTTLGDVLPNRNSSLIHVELGENNLSLLKNSSFRSQTNIKAMWLSQNNLKVLTSTLFCDLFNITLLFLNKNSIMHIEKGTFMHLRTIKHLDISNNKISDISNETFYNLITLEELLLNNNNIKNVAKDAFKYLIKLKTLDLSENNIIILDFNITSLLFKAIRLNQNFISLIDEKSLQTLPDMNEIELKTNVLTWEDILCIKIPGLKSLVISNNNFTHLDNKTFSHLLSLRSLTLEMSNISKLPPAIFFKNQNLLKVNLAHNNLKDLSKNVFAYSTILQELNLTGNRFTDFPHVALFNVTSLEVLDLCHNQLQSFDFYKLARFRNLRTLNMCHNRISVLSGFKSDSLKNLGIINLSHNMITVLPPNFLQHSLALKEIDLSYNFFRHIPSNSKSETIYPIVTVLNMSSNPIEQLLQTYPIKQFPLLEELIVTNTNLSIITSKDFENFNSLKKLVVTQSPMTRISPGAFLSLNKLETLDLSRNQLEMLPRERLRGLYSARLINISRNTITELEVFTSDLQNLEMLDLSFNHISSIIKDVFQNLLNLRELYLSDNWLSTIVSDIFSKSRKIEYIDLSRNYFENIPLKMLLSLEMQISKIAFDDNPMTCNCESQDLWIWMQHHYKIVLQGNAKLRCEYPENLRGFRFLELPSQKLCDVPVVIRIAIQDIQTYSVLVSWQSRNQSGLNGYQVAYFREQMPTIIRGKALNSTARTTRLNHLTPGARYVICVIAVGDFGNIAVSSTPNAIIASPSMENSGINLYGDEQIFNNLRSYMNDSYTSKCTSVSTIEIFSGAFDNPFSNTYMGITEMLMRRLSLVVGCCIGLLVFTVLVSVLGYKKRKKRPVVPKDVVQQPPQYISYDNFTPPNDEVQSTDIDINTFSKHNNTI